MLSIITADERAKEPHGVKLLIVGPSNVGKTYLTRSLDPASTAFVDNDHGTLSIIGWQGDMVRPQTWVDCRDLVVRLGGADPAASLGAAYSVEHLERAGGLLSDAARYQTIIIDSITSTSRLTARWAETQSESFSDKTGRKDIRALYGLIARELLLWIYQWQRIHTKNIVFIAVLEQRVDEFGHGEWRAQIEGSKTAREIIPIVDQVVTMQWVDFGRGPIRAFVCQPNQWNYPSKDRSGKLDLFEPPDLAKLITKLNGGNSKQKPEA
jgi:hypothetical protein